MRGESDASRKRERERALETTATIQVKRGRNCVGGERGYSMLSRGKRRKPCQLHTRGNIFMMVADSMWHREMRGDVKTTIPLGFQKHILIV